MRTSKKDRRSERIPVAHRLILSILGVSGAEMLKEIITTVEVSQHGARIRGRRTLQRDWKGMFVQLSSGRQAPVRVVWQVKPSEEAEFYESGVEILAEFNFWGRAFASPDLEPEQAGIAIEEAAVTPEEFLQELKKSSAFRSDQNGKLLEAMWCGLIEQLEERRLLTRKELVAAIRKVAQK